MFNNAMTNRERNPVQGTALGSGAKLIKRSAPSVIRREMQRIGKTSLPVFARHEPEDMLGLNRAEHRDLQAHASTAWNFSLSAKVLNTTGCLGVSSTINLNTSGRA